MKYSMDIIKRNERLSTWNGAASIIAQSFMMSFIPLFAIQVLGASNFQIGLISSMPSLMTMLAMIPGAIWISRLELKKAFTAYSIFAARFGLFLISLIPFIPYTNHAWILVVFIGLLNFPNALATLSWQSFIGDLIPDERRGKFFSQRSQILTIVGMITTFITGALLNIFDKTDPVPYQWIFLLGFLFGILEVYYLIKHTEIKKTVKKQNALSMKMISGIFQHKPYLYFLICAIIFNFGWQMAWPLFNIYQINDAHATAFWISVFTVANQISQIVSYKWWGRFSDRYGNTVMLFIAAMGIGTAPFLTILSTNLYYLALTNLWTGTFVAGTVMLLFNQLLRVSPEENRTAFLANYNFLIALMGCIAPQIGVWLLELYGVHFAMTFSSIIRWLGAFSFLVVVYIEYKSRKKEKALKGPSISV
ncbi:MFS transporter [Bacillus pinisoli]|uniref:MFS transporter n=1 Tax=Bacillus pinisoli TaxID=2901866 RepID=UPI001FF3ECD4|nr:MFS transporter [Bacillus pinisoli]